MNVQCNVSRFCSSSIASLWLAGHALQGEWVPSVLNSGPASTEEKLPYSEISDNTEKDTYLETLKIMQMSQSYGKKVYK